MNPASLYAFPNFSFYRYLEKRPILDWIGVRYLVVDHRLFCHEKRQDHIRMIATNLLPLVYNESEVAILISHTAQSRACYMSHVVLRPDHQAILRELGANPALIQTTALVEASALAPTEQEMLARTSAASSLPVPITESRPNRVKLHLAVSSAGLLVLKDAYCPGWSATRNGTPVPILRVNGIVRGVLLPGAGSYEVIFTFRPPSFVAGVSIALCCAAFVLVALVLPVFRQSPWVAKLTSLLAVALALVVACEFFLIYTGF